MYWLNNFVDVSPDWQIRGASGLEFGMDLPNIPALSSDWSFRDWSRFTNFWNTELKQSSMKTNRDVGMSSVRSMTTDVNSTAVQTPRVSSTAERERQLAQDDAVVKSSTDKLSAVMDWLIEQVPSTSKAKLSSQVGFGDLTSKPDGRKVKRSELETKKDLERFYIALCRKMYDEGL